MGRKKSWWCKLGFHKWGEYLTEAATYLGYPVAVQARRCMRSGCTACEVFGQKVTEDCDGKIELKEF